ncbi:MAG: ABC transporter substrate-binding protein [Betaproteobacteria bacterium]|nr:ABC transporter substrate-binding protein [Betaproteobacteria bacterium]NBY04097.1 ABC transporter substrate-binding protein [Betaproteobacteria bacterium]
MPEGSLQGRRCVWHAAGVWLLLVCVGLGHSVSAATPEVRDDRGEVIRLQSPPQRIVTLLPALAESVCALGACERLVGTDRFANWPASVLALPKLGGMDDVSLEALVRLRPDLVLLGRSARLLPRLVALGIPVMALEPQTQAQVQHSMQRLALVLGLPEPTQSAARVWQQVQAQLAQARAAMPPQAVGARVYFEAGSGGYAAGEASFIGELIADLGLRNVVPAPLGPFPQLSPEWLLRSQPDLIMIGQAPLDPWQRRPAWSQLAAVQQGRVCHFTPEQGDLLVRPGPRLGEAALWMAQCVRRSWKS